MRKLIAAAAVVVLSFGGANAAFATPPNWSPNVFIRGVYNCHLTGGFIVQPGSTGLAQFTLDGKGNVTSAPGELIVTLGEITTPSTPDDGFFSPIQRATGDVHTRLPAVPIRLIRMVLEHLLSIGLPAAITLVSAAEISPPITTF